MKLMNSEAWLQKLKKPYVLCVVTEAAGSAPGKAGFKMAVFPDGSIEGTVGGGDIERAAIETAVEMHRNGITTTNEDFLLHQRPVPSKKTGKASRRTAMQCGGTAKIFFELYRSREQAILFGGGHLAQELAPLLQNLGFDVEVRDNRTDYAVAEKYPEGTEVRIGDYSKLAGSAELTPSTYCVIFTHGHAHDYLVLKALLKRAENPAYIGMIGSRSKVALVKKRLVREKIPAPKVKKVFAPIGLNIGGDSPAEIALSIAAEILAVRYGKPCVHMRERK